jgi:energy-coupling factor transporter ATP-binding protein EcfA2
MEVAAGECVGLIGPNGAGKSTFLLHLNGLLPETPGKEPRVFVDGIGLVPETAHEVRRRVGHLFQVPDDQLFCATVFEDVAFGPRQLGLSERAVCATVSESLCRVGLPGFENRMPHHLSQGEKRRVCLAGTLACGPSLLVLDEPTSDLDPRGRRELKALLREIPAAKLIATHDLEMVVELCDRAILMDAGKIVCEGPPGELLADEARMLAHGLERPHILLHHHPHPLHGGGQASRGAGESPLPASGSPG